MDIIEIKAFQDNYIWMINLPDSTLSYVVDPGDPEPVFQALTQNRRKLGGILITHHHPDHTGGIVKLTERYQCPVFGPDSTHIPQVTDLLRGGEQLKLDSVNFEIIEVPGHTLDHIAYYSADHKVLFCGDTLFAGGCGRMFEGQPEQMLNSLSKLAALPEDTKVYCAHEYTQANLSFALAVEPDNKLLVDRAKTVDSYRALEQSTVPSTIGVEKSTNPFLRTREPNVHKAAQLQKDISEPMTETEVFAAIRGWKDNF